MVIIDSRWTPGINQAVHYDAHPWDAQNSKVFRGIDVDFDTVILNIIVVLTLWSRRLKNAKSRSMLVCGMSY